MDPIANFLGDWSQGTGFLSIVFRVFISLIMGAIIGCERSSKRHSAGLRTFILVMLTATVAMLLDVFIAQESHIYVVSASVIIAVSIICINSIVYSSRNRIKGLTTSVALWACAILGLTIGAGYYTVSLIAFIAFMLSLSLFPKFEMLLKDRSNHFEIHLELTSASVLSDFITTIRKLGLRIDDIEINPAYAGSGLSVYTVSLSIVSEELKKYKSHAEIISAIATIEYVNHVEEMLL